VADARGRLAWDFPYDWVPQHHALLQKVLAENRRYQRIRNERLLGQLRLKRVGGGLECDEELSRASGGLSYAEMVQAAREANFRHALWQIAEAIADLTEQVVRFLPRFDSLPPATLLD
jgi:hypothetical protein